MSSPRLRAAAPGTPGHGERVPAFKGGADIAPTHWVKSQRYLCYDALITVPIKEVITA